MKFFLVFAALCAVALAAPLREEDLIEEETNVGTDGFKFVFQTPDATTHYSEGHLKDIGTDHEAIVVKGHYSWEDEKTGQKFTVHYTADENGYHATGDHLP